MVHHRAARSTAGPGPAESAPPQGPSRRSVLGYSALAALLGPALASCARDQPLGARVGASASPLNIASPTNPVIWPITDDNPPIASGLAPEQGATLQLYNYADYLAPDAVKSFEKKYRQYDVKVKVSTFNDSNEALAKIRGGSVPFDIYFPSYDAIGKLATTGLIRPLTHDYLPGIANVWPEFQDPFYDSGWRYSIPYMVYTTGIAWRTDKVSEAIGERPNPWDVFWDRRYAGKLSVLDDYRETLSMALLHGGDADLNTDNQISLDKAQADLLRMTRTTHPTVSINAYSDLPGGRYAVSHCWSGDAVNMPYYLPKGGDPGVLRYWFPENGRGLVNNDLAVLMRTGRNPVLSHLFLEHLLDPEVALANLSATGYQPPQNTLTAEKLVADEYIPKNLRSATVLPGTFETGVRTLELPPEVDARWQAVWQRFKAGA
jgi:spermidine/putrescine transport system substrate-binding protein